MRELTYTDSRIPSEAWVWDYGTILWLRYHSLLHACCLKVWNQKLKDIDYWRNKRILREWADNVPRMINSLSKMSKCGKHMTPGDTCFACQMAPDPPPHPSSLLWALPHPWCPFLPWPALPPPPWSRASRLRDEVKLRNEMRLSVLNITW